jgi:hypothetical protein
MISLRKSFLALLILLSFSVCSNESVSAVLTIDGEQNEALSQGSVYTFRLVIHPINDLVIEKSSFEHNDFLDFLYITKVLTTNVSPHNSDAYVVRFDAIVASQRGNQKTQMLDIKNLKIPVQLNVPNIQDAIKADGTFVLFKQERIGDSLWGWLSILMFFIIGVTVFYTYRKRFFKKNKKTPLLILKENVLKYSDKEQIEYLYRNRETVAAVVVDCEVFFQEINKYQYTPNWSNDTYKKFIDKKNEVLEALNELP